ncbi:MAG: hypothetical protein EAX96_01440 [Candidatus Lokiarchaeota archaeon]|nr:hypothetical protein [Candidatus Lokiarchaeota archaeon]
MDYIITYEFPPGVEQKYKSNIGSILKRRYEDKGYMHRLGKGKLYVDFKKYCEEIIEKLKKNKAKILKIEEIEERPNFYDKYTSLKIQKKIRIKNKAFQKEKQPDNEKINKEMELLKEGFDTLYNFFIWVKENNEVLLKNPKMYVNRLKQLDLDLIDKIYKEAIT